MRLRGRVVKMGDNISTDDIIPARYLHLTEPQDLAQHVFEDRPEIRERLEKTPKPVIIVAGKGFGYGSSREHAPISLKASGIAAVIAESFHRIFFRNSINNALPLIELPQAPQLFEEGEEVEIDLDQGVIHAGRGELRFPPYPPELAQLLARGGLRRALEEAGSSG